MECIVVKYEKRHTFSNTPEVFTTLDDTAVGGGDILSRTDDGERHSLTKDTCVLRRSSIIIGLNGWLVAADTLGLDGVANLQENMRCHPLLEHRKVNVHAA